MTEQYFWWSGQRYMSSRQIEQLKKMLKKNYAKIKDIQQKAEQIQEEEAKKAEQELVSNLSND